MRSTSKASAAKARPMPINTGFSPELGASAPDPASAPAAAACSASGRAPCSAPAARLACNWASCCRWESTACRASAIWLSRSSSRASNSARSRLTRSTSAMATAIWFCSSSMRRSRSARLSVSAEALPAPPACGSCCVSGALAWAKPAARDSSAPARKNRQKFICLRKTKLVQD